MSIGEYRSGDLKKACLRQAGGCPLAPCGHTCVGLTLTELVLSVLFWVPSLLDCIFTTLRKDSPKAQEGCVLGAIPGVVHVRRIPHPCSVPSALLETHGVDCCHFKKAFTFVFIGDTGDGTWNLPHATQARHH